MGKDKAKLEQKHIIEITKKIEQNDYRYFENPNIQFITSQNFSDYKWTVIHLAVWYNRFQILGQVLKNPEVQNLINIVDTNSETALHLAFFDRKYECAIVLLENGAKFDVKNYVHQRPVDVVGGMKENQIQFLNKLISAKGFSNDEFLKMCNMIQRKINKIKKLSQNQIDDQTDILLTKSDIQVYQHPTIEIEGPCNDDIPFEGNPNLIIEFKTKQFIHIDFNSTAK